MSTEVETGDWVSIDSWWSVFGEAQSIPRNDGTVRVIDPGRVTEYWAELDLLWQAFTGSSSLIQSSAPASELAAKQLTESWVELDPWWDEYTGTGDATAGAIADLLEQSNEEWRRSDAPFDTDPLAADLTLDRLPRGPLQPVNEMGWSRWLARLLAPSPALVYEVFDVQVAQLPDDVIREDQLAKDDGSIRRPDILLCYENRGLSIEVKLDDTNYRKTPETAALVEHHYDDRVWTHALLLPERKFDRLKAIVEPSITPSDERPQIEWEEPGPVGVIHWCDVTAAIRSLLRQGDIVDDHWASNAYLFCAVAEQQLMKLQPKPIIDRMNSPSNVVDTSRPIQFSRTLEKQLTYLQGVVNP